MALRLIMKRPKSMFTIRNINQIGMVVFRLNTLSVPICQPPMENNYWIDGKKKYRLILEKFLWFQITTDNFCLPSKYFDIMGYLNFQAKACEWYYLQLSIAHQIGILVYDIWMNVFMQNQLYSSISNSKFWIETWNHERIFRSTFFRLIQKPSFILSISLKSNSLEPESELLFHHLSLKNIQTYTAVCDADSSFPLPHVEKTIKE